MAKKITDELEEDKESLKQTIIAIGEDKEFKKKQVEGAIGAIKTTEKIAAIARIAGCPSNKEAGLFLHQHVNGRVSQGDKLLTIYSETQSELNYAKKLFGEIKPITIK